MFTSLQTGFVCHYTFVMLAGLTAFLLHWLGLWSTISAVCDTRLLILIMVLAQHYCMATGLYKRICNIYYNNARFTGSQLA